MAVMFIKFLGAVGLMTRRWDRAQKFNLNPPAEVRDILMALGGLGCEANYCLWHERI